jgi:hypothetical protein
MDATQRKSFDAYFDRLANDPDTLATTPADKLRLLDKMEKDARERGFVPISATQTAVVPVNTPRVQAILAGKEISLGGVEINAQQGIESKLAPKSAKQSVLMIILIILAFLVVVPFLAIWAFWKPSEPEPTATITPTPTPSPTATQTPSPISDEATSTPYALVMATAKVPGGVNDPVSVEFGGVTFVLYESSLQGGEWQPSVAEWLKGTELRRVLAVPYSGEVGNAVAGMKYGDWIKLRLNSGEVVLYQIVEIARVKRHQIEILAEQKPSVAILLYGERSADRYVLIGDAVQPGSDATATPTATTPSTETPIPPTLTATVSVSATLSITPTATTIPPTATFTPTLTPSLTPTPRPTDTSTPTITPAFAFTPPPLVTVVITEAQSITNDLAGLRLDVSNCVRVAQIGSREGRFLLCDVTLTALRSGAEYSGQAIAIAEFSQVEKSSDWWPSAMTIVGGIGDGSLAGVGNTISGKIAGEIAKRSEPVLLWEQAGIRFVITLEETK